MNVVTAEWVFEQIKADSTQSGALSNRNPESFGSGEPGSIS